MAQKVDQPTVIARKPFVRLFGNYFLLFLTTLNCSVKFPLMSTPNFDEIAANIKSVKLKDDFFTQSLDTLQDLFCNPNLDTSDPNVLAINIMRVCKHHGPVASYLFSCLSFGELTLQTKLDLLSCQQVNLPTAFPDIYHQLADLLKDMNSAPTGPPIKRIEYKKADPFNGVFSYLNRLSHGNCMERSMVMVYASTQAHSLVKPTEDSEFISKDNKNSWVIFDFGEFIPRVNGYSLVSYNGQSMHMSSWELLASNNLINWVSIHKVEESNGLKPQVPTTFQFPLTPNYRFFKLVQLRRNRGGSHEICLRQVEFYGECFGTKYSFNPDQPLKGFFASQRVPNSTYSSSDELFKIFDYENAGVWESASTELPYLTFDFMDKRVAVKTYSIKQESVSAGFIKEWRLEGSLDGSAWKTLSHRKRKYHPSQKQRWEAWDTERGVEDSFRFVRFTHLGANHCGDHVLRVTNIEFFGDLTFP